MRTQRRGVSMTAPPPEWQFTCRQAFVDRMPFEPRIGDRSWWREFVELVEEGFVRCSGPDDERRHARSIRCSCAWEMSVRVFELIGDEGELVARRTYAVCAVCGEWAEI